MYCLTIRQGYHTEKPIFNFRHLYPTPNPTVSLDYFPERRSNCALDPFLSDYGPIRSQTDGFKIACRLHIRKVADFRFMGLNCRLTFW